MRLNTRPEKPRTQRVRLHRPCDETRHPTPGGGSKLPDDRSRGPAALQRGDFFFAAAIFGARKQPEASACRGSITKTRMLSMGRVAADLACHIRLREFRRFIFCRPVLLSFEFSHLRRNPQFRDQEPRGAENLAAKFRVGGGVNMIATSEGKSGGGHERG